MTRTPQGMMILQRSVDGYHRRDEMPAPIGPSSSAGSVLVGTAHLDTQAMYAFVDYFTALSSVISKLRPIYAASDDQVQLLLSRGMFVEHVPDSASALEPRRFLTELTERASILEADVVVYGAGNSQPVRVFHYGLCDALGTRVPWLSIAPRVAKGEVLY